MQLNPKDIRAIEIRNDYYKNDLEVSLKEYHEFLDALMYLHETLAELKVKMEDWRVYSDTLMTKFFFHSNTIHSILKGSRLKSRYFNEGKLDKKILDIPSLKVVLRAQLETFLMYHHLYVNPQSDDLKELRVHSWIHASLLKRGKLPASTPTGQQQKAKDEKEILRLTTLMKELKSFTTLTQNQQTRLISSGSDKLFLHWDKIFIETGFDKGSQYFQYYFILSSYAHSEALSILQIKDSRLGYNKHNKSANLNLFLSKLLICKMIMSIKKLFKVVEIKYNMLPQAIQDKVELYAKML